MKKYFLIIIILMVAKTGQCDTIENRCYNNFSEVLKCFVEYQDNSYKYESISSNNTDSPGDSIKKSFILYSHKWPINHDSNIKQTVWQHKLNIYIPNQVIHNKALLFIAGGYNGTVARRDNVCYNKSQK